jgi:hypothetical protein
MKGIFMIRLNTKISLLVFLLPLAAFARAGGWSSSGGDNLNPQDGMAWFMGTAPIKFCIQSGPKFGVPDAQVSDLIVSVGNTWADYVRAKGEGYGIDTHLQGLKSCDGTEDLTFYLGIDGPKAIQKAKKLYDDPSAYVVRTQFDMQKGWSKGAVWVAASGSTNYFMDWSSPNLLKGILLHEMGHIVGCAHVQGTIMRSDITSLFFPSSNMTPKFLKYLGQIDQDRELRICETCALDVTGNDYYYADTSYADQATVFKTFVGRMPVGPITAHVTRKAGKEDDMTRDYLYTLGDSAGSSTVAIHTVFDSQVETESDAPLFKTSNSSAMFYSTVLNGTVHGADGTFYFVTISKSTQDILDIEYMTEKGAVYMFSTAQN